MHGGPAEHELFELIAAGDVASVRRLLEREPAAAGARDGEGVSALMHALYRGHGDLVALLRAASPRLDVFEAAALGDVDALAGSDPNVYSPDGFTPLHLAAFGGHARAVRALLARRADPNALSRHATIRVRPLHTACALEVAVESPEVVRALLEAGADANGRTTEGGATPLHNAAASGSVELVQLLLEYGADAEARLDDGRTPAALASDDAVLSLLAAAPPISVDE